jgi:hypothetical protein
VQHFLHGVVGWGALPHPTVQLACIQPHGGANQRLQRLAVDFIAFTNIDGAPDIALQAGVEQD